jgi:hypothetical protein
MLAESVKSLTTYLDFRRTKTPLELGKAAVDNTMLVTDSRDPSSRYVEETASNSFL